MAARVGSRVRKRRRGEPETAADAMVAAFSQAGLSDQARRLRIWSAWAACVGARIAQHTEPHTFSRGVLTVRTFSSAWQNELTFLKAEMITRLNEKHPMFAWLSLFSVGLTDVYIRLVSMGIIRDWRII